MKNHYYSRRTPKQAPDYEQAYWGTVVDPDGNTRDRLQERAKHLEDVKQELEFLNTLPPGRLLDVGCGMGYLLSGVRAGWEKHGVEVSRFAAEHAQAWGRIFVGELQDAHYPANYFDAIVIHHVIEHLTDPEAAIQEMYRLLRPNGVLVLGTPDFDSGAARRFGENYRLLHDPTHVSLFTNESMRRFLQDYDFVIDRVEYPFFDTRYFTPENLLRLFDTEKISPPFYGNFMTFYCHKPAVSHAYHSLMDLSRAAARAARELDVDIFQACTIVADALKRGHQVLACGNGGSAADAQHFVAELMGHMAVERRPLPAIALSSDPSIVTALGNDYGFDQIFARQVEALGREGDVLIAISTSGRSPNVLHALKMARARGMQTIALLGVQNNPQLESDLEIHVPCANGQRVQEIHTAILHAICAEIENRLVSK